MYVQKRKKSYILKKQVASYFNFDTLYFEFNPLCLLGAFHEIDTLYEFFIHLYINFDLEITLTIRKLV